MVIDEKGLTELVAEAIYDAMREHDPAGQKRPWVTGGNSLKQDEARQRAGKVISAALTQHINDVEILNKVAAYLDGVLAMSYDETKQYAMELFRIAGNPVNETI